MKAAHVDLVALMGTEFEREPGEDFESSVILEPTFVFGWEF